MEIVFTDKAVDDLKAWRKTGNKQVQKRISQLLESIQNTPLHGIGKPELLKHELTGKWSRRITQEHRMVYEVEVHRVVIISLMHHY